MNMKKEVIPPDPAARKRVVIFFGIAFLWSFLCLIICIPMINAMGRQSDVAPDTSKLILIVGALFLPIVVFSVYLIIMGFRVIKAGIFPLPGTKNIRSVTVRRGVLAKGYGIIMLVTAIGLLLAIMRILFLIRELMAGF